MFSYTSVLKKSLLAIICAALWFNASAQTNQEQARDRAKEAIRIEDDGNYDDALKLLESAQKLDPQNLNYPYEIAYIWYVKKDYQRVIDKLETLKDNTDSFDRIYQLLGKTYDVLDKHDKAIAAYDDGLKKFPKSGLLYLERGLITLDDKKYDDTLKYFEKGIEAAPAFPSNYYWVTKLYCNSSEPIWGLLYGELFMNMERSGNRNDEISALLFNTYKSQITFPEPGKPHVNFSKQIITDGRKPDKMPYSLVYEPTMGAAVMAETEVDLNSLDRIRKNFLKFYNDRGFAKTYPNVLFAYQDKITAAACMEAYNHWLLRKGDEQIFMVWKAQNPAKWQQFINWFGANPIKLDDVNRFYRTQY